MAREHCGQQRDTTIGSPPMPTLTLVAERTPLRAYDLNGVVINIGRGDDMDVVIDNPSVSMTTSTGPARLGRPLDCRGSQVRKQHVPEWAPGPGPRRSHAG